MAARLPFPWAYWAAHLGLMIAYIPVFGLFLPVRVAQLSDMPLTHQSGIVLVGSITASFAGVMAGRLSDAVFARTGSRRPMLWAGLEVIAVSYVLFAMTGGLIGVLAAVIILQIGINLTLAGLNALFAVHVAAQDKAPLASIINLGLPIANLGLVLIGGAEADGLGVRLAALGALSFAMFAPILLWRASAAAAVLTERPSHWVYAVRPAGPVWLALFSARSLVQLSAALLLTFAQPYLVAVLPASEVSRALLIMVVLAAVLSVPLALFAARLAAHRVNPIRLLQIAALVLAGAMALLASAPSPALIIASYAVFMSALVTYLAVDTAVIAQWLARSTAVATRLGMMNLANTLPGIIVPALLLIWGGAAAEGLTAAFIFTATGAAVAAGLLAFGSGRLSPPA